MKINDISLFRFFINSALKLFCTFSEYFREDTRGKEVLFPQFTFLVDPFFLEKLIVYSECFLENKKLLLQKVKKITFLEVDSASVGKKFSINLSTCKCGSSRLFIFHFLASPMLFALLQQPADTLHYFHSTEQNTFALQFDITLLSTKEKKITL